MEWILNRRKIFIWQVLFLLLSTSWLFAPSLNHHLSVRTSLISQYETPAQPFSELMRIADFLSGVLVLGAGGAFIRTLKEKWLGVLLLLIGLGLLLDPVLSTTCRVKADVCEEYFSLGFVLHASETVMTAVSFFVLAVYDSYLRKRLVSIIFSVFQIGYFVLFIGQYAQHGRFNTLSQFFYQTVLVAWLAWFCRDFVASRLQSTRAEGSLLKYAVGGWAFLNGLLAILLSLKDLPLYGRLKGVYFVGDNAWLAQHGVIIGVVLIYLSRHLARGERRARQIFLAIAGLEILKYSVITPHAGLLILFILTFVILFSLGDLFDRGTSTLTWSIRAKDLAFMAAGLLLATVIALLVLDSDDRVSIVAKQAVDSFFDNSVQAKLTPHSHLQSVLLSHTISAFLVSSLVALLWILFKPNAKSPAATQDLANAKTLLKTHANSSEDFFKIWPKDKDYFWSRDGSTFIAYRTAGPVVFALADPIGRRRSHCMNEFIVWSRNQGLRACFLPIPEERLHLYRRSGLNIIQIGSSALIDIEVFNAKTVNDKWWRWQRNRAEKSGYKHDLHQPPHSKALLDQLQSVSDDWLSNGSHTERGFALGYFNRDMLDECVVHSLSSDSGEIIAFTNQLPAYIDGAATVDLLRYKQDASGAMPFLLAKTIESIANDKSYKTFDLGFVPFAAVNSRALSVAKALSAGRFSSKGLEQFKNKFDPVWVPNYLAYDGDLADLVLIALNLEKSMSVK